MVSVAPCLGASEKSIVAGAWEAERGCEREGAVGIGLSEKFIGVGKAPGLLGATGCGDNTGGRTGRAGGTTGRGITIASGGGGGGTGRLGAGAGCAGGGGGGDGIGTVCGVGGGVGVGGGSAVACGVGTGGGGGAGGAAGVGICICGFGTAGPCGWPPSNTIATVEGGGSSSSWCS